MMLIDLTSPDAIIPALKAASKKQALQEICACAARVSGLGEREIFDAVLQRERLGSTGHGSGVAIPHCVLGKDHQVIGVFARLERPVDFDSLDGVPVDLIFLLIAPEAAGADYLKAQARAARMFRDANFTARLRATKESAALFHMLTQAPTSHAA
jgi:PTS system nitrogen regulatory IIA component